MPSNMTFGVNLNPKEDNTYSLGNATHKWKINDIVLGDSISKNIDTAIIDGSTSVNLPTSAAVVSFIEGKGYTTNSGTVISVQVGATSPIVSSNSTAQSSTLSTTISLANAYGDTQNPYGNKTSNYVLAGPTSTGAAVPSFRALVAADMPSSVVQLNKDNLENKKLVLTSQLSSNNSAWPGIALQIDGDTLNTDENNDGATVLLEGKLNANLAQLSISQKIKGSSNYETYRLPETNAALTTTLTYEIITTKNATALSGTYLRLDGSNYMTENLKIVRSYPSILLRATDVEAPSVMIQASVTNTTTRLTFYNKIKDATAWEGYRLPATTTALTAAATYDILTTKTHKIYAGIVTISSVGAGALNTTLTYTNMKTSDCAVVVTPIGASNAILLNLRYSVSSITATSARLYLYNQGSSALTNVQLSYIVMAKT